MKRSGFRRLEGKELARVIARERDRRTRSAKAYEQKRRDNVRDVAKLRRSSMPRENRKRRQKRREESFGIQAEACRHLPCCVCRPELYTNEFLALEHWSPVRISDPHHIVKRPAGKDEDAIPLCMGPEGHHRACSGINSSERQVEESARRGRGYFRYVARLIARELRGNRKPDE